MKLSFAFKVPIRQRLKILFLGGFHFTIEYRGQHKITNIHCAPMRVKKTSVTIKKEKSK
jgi:hypothetical protein